jgi:hypothetical protein
MRHVGVFLLAHATPLPLPLPFLRFVKTLLTCYRWQKSDIGYSRQKDRVRFFHQYGQFKLVVGVSSLRTKRASVLTSGFGCVPPLCGGWLVEMARSNKGWSGQRFACVMELVAIVWQWLCACLHRSPIGERVELPRPVASLLPSCRPVRRGLRVAGVREWITAVGWCPARFVPVRAVATTQLTLPLKSPPRPRNHDPGW